MIALDTNVLVRLAVEDDAAQWERAQGLIRKCIDHDERCLVNLQVLCELIWVVRRSEPLIRPMNIDHHDYETPITVRPTRLDGIEINWEPRSTGRVHLVQPP